ncbi:MAG TPA: FkbM family methyltransferase [Allosphingosinicella sp.]|jgi:FkbM family methyltransferase
MNLKEFARHLLEKGMGLVAAHTLFSPRRRLRSVGFDVLSSRQRLIVCAPPEGEVFVVHSGDEFIGRELFLSGEFDFDKFAAAIAALKLHRPNANPQVLIDVGANIGSICIAAVARGFVGRAIAVEPDPNNSRLLRANVALNGLERQIRTVEMAAGPVDGAVLELEISSTNLGDHRIRVTSEDGRLGEANRNVVQVPSSTLDSICADEQSGELLIWMDTQGFEGFVLRGSTGLLARKIPLVLEFWPYGMKRAGSFSALTESLAGYSQFLDLEGTGGLRPIAELELLYRELGEEQAFTDILVI